MFMLLDGIILAILLGAFLAGYRKGIIYMIFFFLGLLLGIIAALKFSTVTAGYLLEWFHVGEKWLPILSLAVTFLGTFLLVRFVAAFLERILKTIHLNFINKLVGGALGAGIGFLCLSVLVWYISGFGFISTHQQESSNFLPMIQDLAPGFIAKAQSIIPFMGDLLESIKTLFEESAPSDTNSI